MNQAGDLVLMLSLHRHHVAVGPHRDDGLLEIAGLAGGDELLQNLPDLGGCGTDVPPDRGQLRACRIGDLILSQDRAGNLFLQEPVGGCIG